jgi:hypothetical protein
LDVFGQRVDTVEEDIEQMLLVYPTQLGKEFDRDASVLVFDKALDDG